MSGLLAAVEVGSAAVGAAVFDAHGRQVAGAAEPVAPEDGQAAYRMDAVWHAAGLALRACLADDPARGRHVAGLGFAAMPGLVLDCAGEALLAGGADMMGARDRRAAAEAAEIAATGDDWLDRHGGAPAPGNSLARMLWLKRHAPGAWARLRTARDLCDELARRATGIEAHSVAALATQWPWRADTGWNHALLDLLDLGEVVALGALDGGKVAAGTPHGPLDPGLAELLGLPPGIPVAAGLPADHAGLLGTIGRASRAGSAAPPRWSRVKPRRCWQSRPRHGPARASTGRSRTRCSLACRCTPRPSPGPARRSTHCSPAAPAPPTRRSPPRC